MLREPMNRNSRTEASVLAMFEQIKAKFESEVPVTVILDIIKDDTRYYRLTGRLSGYSLEDHYISLWLFSSDSKVPRTIHVKIAEIECRPLRYTPNKSSTPLGYWITPAHHCMIKSRPRSHERPFATSGRFSIYE
ncbi:MAG: hypothetical protein UT32_C0028G0013 [Parcubacteria group bacterium GW2011_GWC2_39_14]|nr:MAG: hypothetical protein UT32_C0028G0013 [Parcubacteria group bacterium GW2011_GWC2_39_14]